MPRLTPGSRLLCWTATLFFAATAAPTLAQAQHYFLEGQAGTAIHGGAGPLWTLTFGAGGKVPGSTLRAYGLLEGGLSNTAQGDVSRQTTERLYGQLGVRLLWTLPYPPLRFFNELVLGAAHSDSDLRRSGGVHLRGSEVSLLGTLGIGLQLRLLPALSLTARAQLQYSRDPLAQLRRALELNQGDLFWNLSAGATWHF